jgi:hypothetical protein
VRNTAATSRAGRSNGSVTNRKRRQEEAPSIRAASYNAGSMFWRPASSKSATNGVVFQTSAIMIGTHAAD